MLFLSSLKRILFPIPHFTALIANITLQRYLLNRCHYSIYYIDAFTASNSLVISSEGAGVTRLTMMIAAVATINAGSSS